MAQKKKRGRPPGTPQPKTDKRLGRPPGIPQTSLKKSPDQKATARVAMRPPVLAKLKAIAECWEVSQVEALERLILWTEFKPMG